MKLSEKVIDNLKIAKILHTSDCARITSIDFSSRGEALISSNTNDEIVVFDCEHCRVCHLLNSKKYGVGNIKFTHADNTALYSSTRLDDSIRYLSLHDNKFIRYFSGHTQRVNSLCVSPINDTFLSASCDKSVRLWDLRSPNYQGILHTADRPIVTFDPEGVVFAVGINSKEIKLYDSRRYHLGPFYTFVFNQEKLFDWTDLKFSRDGKQILLSSNGTAIRVIDAFKGHALNTLSGIRNNMGIPIEASFSPDSEFIFSGSSNGLVHVWNAKTGRKVNTLNGNHEGPVQCVKFNPKYVQLVSACSKIAVWLPSEEK